MHQGSAGLLAAIFLQVEPFPRSLPAETIEDGIVEFEAGPGTGVSGAGGRSRFAIEVLLLGVAARITETTRSPQGG
jgi:hypothetical protein